MNYTLQTRRRHTTCCSTRNSDQWDMCLFGIRQIQKLDWRLLFKNQFMLKGIPATHAVLWHSQISMGKSQKDQEKALVFWPLLCPDWIVFPRIVRKYLSISLGRGRIHQSRPKGLPFTQAFLRSTICDPLRIETDTPHSENLSSWYIREAEGHHCLDCQRFPHIYT